MDYDLFVIGAAFDGTLVRIGARTGAGDNEQLTTLMEQIFPCTLEKLPNTTIANSIVTRSPVYVADITQHPDYPQKGLRD